MDKILEAEQKAKEIIEIAEQKAKEILAVSHKEQEEQLRIIMKEGFELYVNGKIDRLATKLDTYIKEDDEWKKGVSPSIDTMKKIQNFSSVTRWIVQTILLVGAVVGAVLYLKDLGK